MQKEELKTQKGITLIALIITIIVMLILVGVTVTVALQGGLFNTAKDAAQKTAEAARQETEMLRYEYEIANAKGETTATFDEYVLDKKYGVKIGDKVNYNEGEGHKYSPDTTKGAGSSFNSSTNKLEATEYENENLEWRVFGVNDNGQIELISTNPTNSQLTLYGKSGYVNLEYNLNTICNELYGKGTNDEGKEIASARSLNIEDLNELAGITTDEKKKHSEYGKKYIIKYDNSLKSVAFSTDNGNTFTPFNVSEYWTSDGIINESNPGPVDMVSNLFPDYKLSDYLTKKIENDTISLANFITSGEDNVSDLMWLASKRIWICDSIFLERYFWTCCYSSVLCNLLRHTKWRP